MENEVKPIRQSYGQYLEKLGYENKNIVVFDADLSSATKTNIFAKTFPDRFFNLGICEQNMLSIAAGVQSHKLIPFVNTFSAFALGRSYDQIRCSICYPNANVKIVGTHYGITVGQDGATHQMLEDIALANTLPNMSIFCPSDDLSTKVVLDEALKIKGPVYIRISRNSVPKIYDKTKEDSLKKGYYISGTSSQNIIFTTGDVANICYEAQKSLDVKIIDIFRIKPIDKEMIIQNSKYAKKIMCIENHNTISGLGTIIQTILNENNINCKVEKLGINDVFGTSGTPEDLLEFYGITEKNIKKYFKQ